MAVGSRLPGGLLLDSVSLAAASRRPRKLWALGWLEERVLDVDDPSSLSGRARGRRWAKLWRRFPELDQMRVVDLGGTPRSWLRAPVRPLEVVCVNVDASEPEPPSRDGRLVRSVAGDACALPPSLRGERFDLVYSNSVLEHVGGHSRRTAFAEAVHQLAERHWVQTPYRYFPLEPHFLFPALQFLPVRAQASLVQRWPFGHYRAVHAFDEAVASVLDVELLSVTEMSRYFPDSELVRERIAGLPKSLIAVIGSNPGAARPGERHAGAPSRT